MFFVEEPVWWLLQVVACCCSLIACILFLCYFRRLDKVWRSELIHSQLIALMLADAGFVLGMLCYKVSDAAPHIFTTFGCAVAFGILRCSRVLSSLMEMHISVGLVLFRISGSECIKQWMNRSIIVVWLFALIMSIYMSFDLHPYFDPAGLFCTYDGQDDITIALVIISFVLSVCCYLALIGCTSCSSTAELRLWLAVGLYPLSFTLCFLPMILEHFALRGKYSRNPPLVLDGFADLGQACSGWIHVVVYRILKRALSNFNGHLLEARQSSPSSSSGSQATPSYGLVQSYIGCMAAS